MGFSEIMTETGKNIYFQIQHNMLKNLNWKEVDQLASYKQGQGVEHSATENQLKIKVRAGLEPRTTGLQV